VLSVDRYGQQADPRRLTLVMFATAAVLSSIIGLVLGGGAFYARDAIAAMSGDRRFVSVNVALVSICSVGAFHLMNTAQPLVSPAVASVVYCLEPVFATAWSVVIGTEAITSLTLGGGGLVVLAMVRLGLAERRPATDPR
jgi:drug/metabolite transporter (DMT)-like permease